MKNGKKINMTDHKLIELIKLRLSTNWTSCTNSTPANLIPLRSSISPSLSILFINILIPPISSYNLYYLHFYSRYNLLLDPTTVTCLSVNKKELSLR